MEIGTLIVTSEHFRWFKRGEWHEERVQYLKQKVIVYSFSIFGKKFIKTKWKIIDKEIVPSAIWQQAAILGFTDWKSKFAEIKNVIFVTDTLIKKQKNE